ncbi:MAG TPA: hypothetical protein VMZ53_18170 [Kofleriaceae bacterium]|nr:hypothetical protein [Kofleriaceae bacterium]
MEFLSRHLGRWHLALAWVFVLAALVLLPGLNSTGLWEPQERQLADRVAPRVELAKKVNQAIPPLEQVPPKDNCYRMAPKDAKARTLTNRAMTWGRDHVSDTDAGRRLPLALLGLLTVLASAGIAMRFAGSRAGVLSTIILLSMPLLVLQSRMLTSEIGTAAGAAMTLYGFIALGERRGQLGIIESLVAVVSLAAGVTVGFLAGGALLGVLVPVGAYAAAHGLGFSLFVTLIGKAKEDRPPLVEQIKALVATLLAIGVAAILIYQLYSLVRPQPGLVPPLRAVFGKAIVGSGCYSSALGGMWRPDDDLRYSFDSTFEQIAYGTFPWGILGPISMFALIISPERRKRLVGGVCLAWGAGAWIAGEAFQRKVGFTIYAGFPALAIATGVWIDSLLPSRAVADDSAPPADDAKPRSLWPAGIILVGFFTALAMIDLGKDLQSFTERLTSLLVGSDQIAYPKAARMIVPTRAWILVYGALVGVGFALAVAFWRDDAKHRTKRLVAKIGAITAVSATLLFALFWSYGWQRSLSVHLSSKAMFDTYRDLRKNGDQLVIMGDMGDAPYDYAPDAKPEVVTGRDQIVAALTRQNRVFAIAPQGELCQLHREIGGKDYFVLDDRNVRSLLLSNKVAGSSDKNPLRTTILHEEPKTIPFKPKGRVVFDGRIELLGWSMPKKIGRGDKFDVKMFYKILQPVGANWKILFHFDGPLRFNGDHEPINGRCATSTWQPGDFIVDTYRVTAGGGAFAPGAYEVWTGFFTGSNPNWKNMTVSEAPPEMRDTADRVKITTIVLD